MTALLTLPTVDADRKPDSRVLLPLECYDLIIVSFSGGKDSLALVLDLLDKGVSPDRIQLWHQDVDGVPGEDEAFMDWPCTRSYVQAIGLALGIRVLFQQRRGGFLGEMLKEAARTRPVRFQTQAGTWAEAGGTDACKISTRLLYPQKTADLSVRWCSAILKIDAFCLAVNNEPTFKRAGIRLLVLTGERREESTGRSKYAEREPHRCDGKRRRVDAWRSVIDWSEADVWAIIAKHRIMPHPAYRLGFPRVSCMGCIFGGADQWASVRKVAPAAFARMAGFEVQFGKTITKGRSLVQQADKGTPYAQTADAGLVALAMGEDYPAALARVPDGVAWTHPAGAFKKGGGPI